MEQKENMSRRWILKTTGAGLGLIMAGFTAAEASSCGGPAKGASPETAHKCGPKPKKCGKSRSIERKQFHHVGIPTQVKHENERYLAGGKVYITDPEKHPYRIEWCRWLPESKDPEMLRTTPHIAFEVPCVDKEIAKYDEKEIFLRPFVPFEGVRVAFINHEGTLIEFLEKTA